MCEICRHLIKLEQISKTTENNLTMDVVRSLGMEFGQGLGSVQDLLGTNWG